MLNLMLHCGAKVATRAEVDAVRTPEATETHFPIPHGHLIDLVDRTLGASHRIIQQAHALDHDGARYFGLMEVVNGHDRQGSSLVIGLRNAHDKAFNANMAAGKGVFCCDNLAFSGEVVIGRKHTRFIHRDLPALIEGGIQRIHALDVRDAEREDRYRSTRLTDKDAHDVIVRALDRRILAPSKLPRVLQEWREPSHEEHAEDGPSVWRLFNAFTEVAKGSGIHTLTKRTIALHHVCDEAAGFAGLEEMAAVAETN